MKIFTTLFSVLLLVAALAAPNAASAKSRYLQCVPFARQVSGIEIRGNAKTWWGQAAGKYQRGSEPRIGAVMAMPGIRSMPLGHVATVAKIVDDREILLTHANWSRRGGIERNVRAVDVSENGDWSRVRIWFARNGDLGTTRYPVSGFIYPVRVDGSPVHSPILMAEGAQPQAVPAAVAATVNKPLTLNPVIFTMAALESGNFMLGWFR